MDLEELANMSSNSTDQIYEHEYTFYERLMLELFTVVGLISITANVLLIFVIVRFKKLRQEVTNIIIAHLNFTEALYLLTTPLSLRVATLLDFVSEVHVTVYCIFYSNVFVLLAAIFMFLVLLVCDWYLKLYNEVKYVKFRRVYKFFVTVVYVLVLFLCTLATQTCFKGSISVITVTATMLAYVSLVVFLIVMNVVHLVKRKTLREKKRNVGLFIANMFLVIWCPALFVMFISLGIEMDITIASLILDTFGFLTPVFTLLYLFFYVDDFNVFLNNVFRCKCNDYGNELLVQHVVYSDENGVKIDKN